MDIQCNTFANWCSCVLSDGNPFFNNIIQDLRVDLCDGVLLAALVSKLTQTYVEYVEPNCDEDCIDNINNALSALERADVFRQAGFSSAAMAGIRAQDIFFGLPDSLTSLCYTLLVHFDIMHFPAQSPKVTPSPPPEDVVLGWLHSLTPPSLKTVDDLSVSWADGELLYSLISAFVSDISLAHGSSPEEIVQRTMETARNELGVPPILAPSHMVDKSCDNISILAYLALVRNCCESEENLSDPKRWLHTVAHRQSNPEEPPYSRVESEHFEKLVSGLDSMFEDLSSDPTVQKSTQPKRHSVQPPPLPARNSHESASAVPGLRSNSLPATFTTRAGEPSPPSQLSQSILSAASTPDSKPPPPGSLLGVALRPKQVSQPYDEVSPNLLLPGVPDPAGDSMHLVLHTVHHTTSAATAAAAQPQVLDKIYREDQGERNSILTSVPAQTSSLYGRQDWMQSRARSEPTMVRTSAPPDPRYSLPHNARTSQFVSQGRTASYPTGLQPTPFQIKRDRREAPDSVVVVGNPPDSHHTSVYNQARRLKTELSTGLASVASQQTHSHPTQTHQKLGGVYESRSSTQYGVTAEPAIAYFHPHWPSELLDNPPAVKVTPHIVYPCLVRSATRSGLQGPNWLVLTPKSCYLISASRPHRVVASWALNLISQFGVHGSSLTIVGSTATQHAGVFDFEVAPGKCAEAYQILLGYASLWH
eukprot:m.263708 g.263708  ORF g.263708 m.263708 type:complete len:704 (+) comp15604_c1_seq11:459-2570(+)